jgi:hypothetical protein
VSRKRLDGRIARLEAKPGYWIPSLPDCEDTRQLIESAKRHARVRAAAREVLATMLKHTDHPERAEPVRRCEMDPLVAFEGTTMDPETWERLRAAARRVLEMLQAKRDDERAT